MLLYDEHSVLGCERRKGLACFAQEGIVGTIGGVHTELGVARLLQDDGKDLLAIPPVLDDLFDRLPLAICFPPQIFGNVSSALREDRVAIIGCIEGYPGVKYNTYSKVLDCAEHLISHAAWKRSCRFEAVIVIMVECSFFGES